MGEQVEHLILEYLRAMRADISVIKLDIRELKMRMSRLETHVTLFGDVVRRNTRLDAIDERLGRVEQRLALQP